MSRMMCRIALFGILALGAAAGCEREGTPLTEVSPPRPSAPVDGAARAAAAPPAVLPVSRPSASEVFATPTGKSYHRRECSSLTRAKSLREMTAAEAAAAKLKPCLRCKP